VDLAHPLERPRLLGVPLEEAEHVRRLRLLEVPERPPVLALLLLAELAPRERRHHLHARLGLLLLLLHEEIGGEM